ncbi:MAG: ABC transporter ATP-binding protein [Planctomycetota bacterium]
MRSDLAISADGLGKRYELETTPRQRLLRLAGFGRSRGFWALRNVNFELQRGASLGVIGGNGSGKSTLLQMIAGTLMPSEGEARVRGRVAALLELGSGFNDDFTGKENASFGCALLGMDKAEIRRRIPEIIDFSGVSEFIDRPVREYSSGMRARLAFAVASSVEPDVLILDEVLSVGDLAFQQRCVGRIRGLLSRGATVLYVSHAMDSVKGLCDAGLYLVGGQQRYFGSASSAVDRFIADVRLGINVEATGIASDGSAQRYGTGAAVIEQIRLLDMEGLPVEHARLNESVIFEVTFAAHESIRHADVAFVVRNGAGVDVFGTSAADEHSRVGPMAPGDRRRIRFVFSCGLRPGGYGFSVTLTDLPVDPAGSGVTLDHRGAALSFSVIEDPDRPVRFVTHVPVAVEHVGVGEGAQVR